MFFYEKDLGIIVDGNLSFQDHIASKVKKANSMMGLIRRSFAFLNHNLFKKLYTTYVRPLIEYGQIIWSPHLKQQINLLEDVQIRATKLVDGFSHLEYPERLKILNLPTLAHRRKRGAMIQFFNHFHIYDRTTLSQWFQPRERITRAHNFQLIEKTPKDGMRGIQSNSFYFRYGRIWNRLPDEVVNAGNLNTFKNRLDKAWINDPGKYDHTLDI